MRNRATFRAGRSNCCRYIVILGFFKMAAVRHLGFVMRLLGHPRHRSKFNMTGGKQALING